MFSHHSARRRVLVSAVFFACALFIVTPAGAAAPVPQQDDEVFDANETEGTIDRVRLQLLGVAAVTGALLVGYIWHTDPQRRLRVATRRREDRERAAVAALEDEFVLPAEVDVGSTDDSDPITADGANDDVDARSEAATDD